MESGYHLTLKHIIELRQSASYNSYAVIPSRGYDVIP